jgi:hypothetical protein
MPSIADIGTYLLKTLAFRFLMFFRRWYVDSFLFAYGQCLHALRALDARIALRQNLRLLFRPLYQEYNVVGYAMGFAFRGILVATGSLLYSLVILLAFALYVAWAVIPLTIICKILIG